MIATILKKSVSFSAVDYNEERRKRGEAEILCKENFGDSEVFFGTILDYKKHMETWSERNKRIKQPQLHVAISAKGNSASKEELLQIGKEWLKQMGYADNPYLIYFHNNTRNNHIHIITSRIDRQGNKINDSYEKQRSLKIIDTLSKTNRHEELRQLTADRLRYSYPNLKQFILIMERAGCTVTKSDDKIKISRAGASLDINMSLFLFCQRRYFKEMKKDDKKKLKSIMKKYALNMSKEDFCSYMRAKFGCEVVFFGDKEKPYGYSIIDNRKKRVVNGREIMPIKELLGYFQGDKDKKQYYNLLIAQILKDNPGIIRKEINNKLLKSGGTLIKESVMNRWKRSVEICPLDPKISEAIQYNNKRRFIINKMNPTSQIELLWIEKRFGIRLTMDDIMDKKKDSGDIDYYKNYIGRILESKDPKNEFVKQELWLYKYKDEILFFDGKSNKTISGNDIGLTMEDVMSRFYKVNEKEDEVFIGMESNIEKQPDIVAGVIDSFIDMMDAEYYGGDQDPVKRNKRKKKNQQNL